MRAGRRWRQLAALDPLSSRVALSLMRALAAAGDRVGALQHARVHEALVRQELDAAPDAAITTLAARLREEPAPTPTSRTGRGSDEAAAPAAVEAAMESEVEEHELDATEAGFRTSPWRLLTTSMRHAIPPAWLSPGTTARTQRRVDGIVAALLVALLALTAAGVWVAAMR